MRQTLKSTLNFLLRPSGLKLEGNANDRAFVENMRVLDARGDFSGPAFPIPDQFKLSAFELVLNEVGLHTDVFQTFVKASDNDYAFTFDNEYFTSPDADVLYAMIRLFKPGRIIEIGSGNSTKISRAAIQHGATETILTSIDPCPRAEIDSLADCVIRERFQCLPDFGLFLELQKGDVLFIDSSHMAEPGSDVVDLFCKVIPRLRSGVLIHVHDVFIPWEYPRDWLVEKRWKWTEQYLVLAMLLQNPRYEVLWPGYYLQRTLSDFARHFPHSGGQSAQSLWLRVA